MIRVDIITATCSIELKSRINEYIKLIEDNGAEVININISTDLIGRVIHYTALILYKEI
jgi:hypothetical protein